MNSNRINSDSRWWNLGFGIAVFLSAFLLFQVQPLVSKAILPWFGGSAAVWTTCMLFFQTMLFAGYAWVHVGSRWLGLRRHGRLHLLLLIVALGWLLLRAINGSASIEPADTWKPGPDDQPTVRVVLLLTTTVGLPFFVLAATGPLLQAWFGRLRPGRSPYRLYALSNVGSLLALLSYPLLVEPNLALGTQAGAWTAAFLACCLAIALTAQSLGFRPGPSGRPATSETKNEGRPRAIVATLLGAVCVAIGLACWLGLLWWLMRLQEGLAPINSPWTLAAVTGVGLGGLCHVVAGVGLIRWPAWGLPFAHRTMRFLLVASAAHWVWQEGHRLVGTGREPNWWATAATSVPVAWSLLALAWLRFTGLHGSGHVASQPAVRPTLAVRGMWFGLTMTASVLLLATTNQVCLDIAAVPFLWILPLALYLLTFIVCFEGAGWYSRWLVLPQLAVSLAAVLFAMGGPFPLPLELEIPIYFAAMFFGCMACHGELVRLQPDPRYLTGFYLTISAGGAAGGLFAGIAAPAWFDGYLELHAGLAGVCLLVLAAVLWNGVVAWRQRNRRRACLCLGGSALWLMYSIPVVLLLSQMARGTNDNVVEVTRSFYGVLRVLDEQLVAGGSSAQPVRRLLHGKTFHGLQFPDNRGQPTACFGRRTGIGIVLRRHATDRPRRVGIVGLGIGTLAVYGRPDDRFTFFELDPDIERLAERHFTFLDDARRHGTQVDVELGDARLALERPGVEQFDVLVIDAFNSDTIPVHLLTREAFELYVGLLAPDGILALNISSSHFDLRPVVETLAEESRLVSRTVMSAPNHSLGQDPALWVLLSVRPAVLDFDELQKLRQVARSSQQRGDDQSVILTPTGRRLLWTDSFSNPFAVIGRP